MDSIIGAEMPQGAQCEVIVMDNASTDNTRSICEKYFDRLPLKYCFEPRQGKSYALNTAAEVASGELMLFTDDDVDVHARWVISMWDAYQRYPKRCFFGGRVMPHWETTPPAWVLRHYTELPHFAQLDWGDQERMAIIEKGEYFPGANSAFPKQVFAEGWRYTDAVGLLDSDARRGYIVGGEDMEFLRTISRAGWQGVYVPSAAITHRHSASRCTERYLRKWYMGSGMMIVRLEKDRPMSGVIFGVPRYIWKAFFLETSRYLLSRWTRSSTIWLPAERRMALHWGMLLEYRHRKTRAEMHEA